jgi:hypothetical protein
MTEWVAIMNDQTAASTPEQRKLLRQLDACPGHRGIVWGHEREILQGMIWSGFVSDVYEEVGGALTACVTQAGRDELEKYNSGT